MFEKVPEILTRGHVVNERRLGLMEERANYSRYLILPTKFPFPRLVRILSYVMSFICKARKNKKFSGDLLQEGQQRFSVFHGQFVNVSGAEDQEDEVRDRTLFQVTG